MDHIIITLVANLVDFHLNICVLLQACFIKNRKDGGTRDRIILCDFHLVLNYTVSN